MNTWPNGYRHAMDQDEHERWNSYNYPGTRQLCVECDEPTGRCEDDSIYTEDGHGPLCLECWHQTDESEKDGRLDWRKKHQGFAIVGVVGEKKEG